MIEVRLATAADRAAAHAVRHEVFVVGQGVPASLEVDGRDDQATHVVALHDGEVVGTARFRAVNDDVKAERVAVLARCRGLGLGAQLMAVLEAEARAQGFRRVVLHAQADVIDFYLRLGYAGHGQRFVEAGIEHLSMHKAL